MKEIINRLQDSREIAIAKKLLESEGYVVKEKKINEGSGDFVKLIFSATSKAPSTPEWDDFYNDLNIVPKDNDVACPWDADVSFENKNVVLTGTLTPGGPGSGTMIVKVPFSQCSKYYDIIVELNDDVDIDDFCNRYGWDYRTVNSMF